MWINVKDRMPAAVPPYIADGEWVLVYTANKAIFIACLCEFSETDVVWLTETGRVLDVTHWQPLPEKPKDF
ncbi:hypothetical protein D3C87_2158110 [compost metagenome]